ncbi:MAG TPA: hypothetical protein VGE77_13575 [Nocardioides sp.]
MRRTLPDVEILLWLVPPAVVTVVAMVWVSWLGRERRVPDRHEQVRRIGGALERPARAGYAVPQARRDRSTGVAVRRPGAD